MYTKVFLKKKGNQVREGKGVIYWPYVTVSSWPVIRSNLLAPEGRWLWCPCVCLCVRLCVPLSVRVDVRSSSSILVRRTLTRLRRRGSSLRQPLVSFSRWVTKTLPGLQPLTPKTRSRTSLQPITALKMMTKSLRRNL